MDGQEVKAGARLRPSRLPGLRLLRRRGCFLVPAK
jgi:hypothetical protein